MTSRTDTERLDWFARNPDNLLAHRFADGTFGFLGRQPNVRWPDLGHEAWQDLRTAIDAAMETPPVPLLFGLPIVENPALDNVELPIVGDWCQESRGCIRADGHEGDCSPVPRALEEGGDQ